MKSHKYLFIRHDKNNQVLGMVWWDGKKIQSDNHALVSILKKQEYDGKEFKDGVEFLEVLPQLYRSGYVGVKKLA